MTSEEPGIPNPEELATNSGAGFPPEDGWPPHAFPQVTIDHIPHTSNPYIAPDPMMTITRHGWLHIETGGHRIAIPDREEWVKFKNMVDATWNDYERATQAHQGKEPKNDSTDTV